MGPSYSPRRLVGGASGVGRIARASSHHLELAMNIVRYMMYFVFGMLLGLLLSALLPSLALLIAG
jgi:hypothetical protein